jgi:hypothetical protein
MYLLWVDVDDLDGTTLVRRSCERRTESFGRPKGRFVVVGTGLARVDAVLQRLMEARWWATRTGGSK